MIALSLTLALACLLAPHAEPRPLVREDPALEAMEVWGDWVAERMVEGGSAGVYVPWQSADSRVLVFGSKKRSPKKHKRVIAKVCKAFDKLVPAPKQAGGEDSKQGAEHEPRCAVLIELTGRDGLASVTGYLGTRFPYLSGWAPGAARGVGFVLEQPLAAAWLVEVPGVKKGEWNPENELVNRLAQLLLVERHGRLPQWIAMGVAWHVELTICKDIYCFPFRSGFVGKGEHKGFASQLASAMASRGDSPLTMDVLAGWPRGTYDEQRAAFAWGAGTLLAKHYAKDLPAVLQAMAARRDWKGRVMHPDGSWDIVPEYEIPAEEQKAMLDEALGVDFLVELGRFARLGRGYSRPR